MDLKEISQNIFSKSLKNPGSIQLDFSDYNNRIDNTDQFIFQQLIVIFTEGMKILYGDENEKVDFSSLTQEDCLKIKQYFNSFGFDISYDILPLSEDKMDIITDSKKESLKDHYFRIRTDKMVYIISFDYFQKDNICKN